MTRHLLDRLRSGDILVGDGATGTMLLDSGLDAGVCPETLNLDRPDRLAALARAYRDAGADIVQTNTFGASPLKLALSDLAEKTEEINANAVHAVRKAVGTTAYICGSCGPSGRLLEPYGDTEPQAVYGSFVRQIQALVGAGVDAICIETMTDLAEATLGVRAARAVSSTIPVFASMTFDPTPRGFITIMGVSVEQAASRLAAAGADVIGSNCGNGIENMVRIAAEFRKVTNLPVLIRPNAGLPEIDGDRPAYRESAAFMVPHFRALVELGVQVIGGCCGTTPEHIAALRGAADHFTANHL
ncbi:MAG: homocysteine S-methyltransferase family protein [Candidatus Zixiibacteriota bacterium]